MQREVRVVLNLGKDEAEKLGVKARILSKVLWYQDVEGRREAWQGNISVSSRAKEGRVETEIAGVGMAILARFTGLLGCKNLGRWEG